MDSDLRIRYIYHSCFIVETAHNLFVFDYYKGKVTLPQNKRIFVLCSHGHPDHFNPIILDWQQKRPGIQYIFSSDISTVQANNIQFMSPYEKIEIDDITIKTYGSTDLGVSFFISFEGIHLFHAGDLNWWYWWNDTKEEIEKAENTFKAEIAKMKGNAIDIAFFPVDPRLEHLYTLGAEYFIQELKPKIFIPMHFGDDHESAAKFASGMKKSSTRVIVFTDKCQEIQL